MCQNDDSGTPSNSPAKRGTKAVRWDHNGWAGQRWPEGPGSNGPIIERFDRLIGCLVGHLQRARRV